MPDFYWIADAMLVTLKANKTISYTLPGKVQSYMAAGKPIIGAINGETMHVVEEADCGLCCCAEDYNQLAELILKFCKSNKKKQMALNAKQFYNDNFSKDKFIEKLKQEIVNLEA